jgi:hypothetical protein
MTDKKLYTFWALAFGLCAGLGFIPNPTGAVRIFLTILSCGFFLPPLVLISRRQPHVLRLIRNLAIASLALTVVLLIANFLSISSSRLIGNVLYSLLVIVSAPMVCGQIWVIGIFGWAYLLFAAIRELRHL